MEASLLAEVWVVDSRHWRRSPDFRKSGAQRWRMKAMPICGFGRSFVHPFPFQNLGFRGHVRASKLSRVKKENSGENLEVQKSAFPLRVLPAFLAQSAVALFGLGFIDAGYSGDWSRIGVIPKEIEELLKMASYIVIPLCIFAIFSISKAKGVSK